MLGECFDPHGDLRVRELCRPHWSQAGAVVFITFRTHDSIPRETVERWEREKQDWLRSRGRRAFDVHRAESVGIATRGISETLRPLPRDVSRHVPRTLLAPPAGTGLVCRCLAAALRRPAISDGRFLRDAESCPSAGRLSDG